jgi:hypothetical protein
MKLILSVLSILFLSIQLFCQNTEGKIIELANNDEITINLGKDIVDVNDLLEIWGDAETIHPATGQIVKSKNLILGKCKVIEVYSEKSKCIIVDRKYQIKKGDKVILLIRKESTSESLNKDENEIKSKQESEAVKKTYTNTILEQVNLNDSDVRQRKELLELLGINSNENGIIGTLNRTPENFKAGDIYFICTNRKVMGLLRFHPDFIENNKGPIELKESFKKINDEILNSIKLLKYRPFMLSVGAHSYVYKSIDYISDLEDFGGLFLDGMIGVNIGVEYFPNRKIERIEKYNNWFWLGANINFDHFFKAGSFEISESFSKIKYDEKLINVALALELGFSPWSTLKRKGLNFGVKQKFQSEIPYMVFTGNEAYVLKNHLPSVFLGYEMNSVLFRICIGMYKYQYYGGYRNLERYNTMFGFELMYLFDPPSFK